jgi:uncharacterized protein (DUF952 family)
MIAADRFIYKICSAELWAEAELRGQFTGAEIDLQDGYIHFSTTGQVKETAAKHFAGQSGLVLVCVATDRLELVWEPSRGGALFPHLYGALAMDAVVWVRPLPLLDDTGFDWPALE